MDGFEVLRTKRRRMRGLALGALVAVAALAMWTAVRIGEGKDKLVSVLVIEENNGRILRAAPDRTPAPLLVATGGPAEPGGRPPQVRLAPRVGSIQPATRLVVYHAVSSGLDLVEDRLWQAKTVPFQAPTGSAAHLMGTVPGAHEPANLVENELRMVPASIDVTRFGTDGTLTLSVRGFDVRLRPGDQWTEGRVRRGNVQDAIPESTWDEVVETAIQAGNPVTVLRITYLGPFRRRDLTATN
ncbi:MAG: hypothetical protein M1602_03650 [Firmicutes bacterium]|nr:hypothetical protein [Bacillota bacterium]